MRLLLLCLLLAACGETEESKRVTHAVRVDGGGVTAVTSDLGYTVTVTRLRSVLRDLRFTRGGESHAGLWPLGWLVGTAHAHPGHSGGGETVGELPGRFVIDWIERDGALLGVATFLEGPYDGADFVFAQGTAADGLDADDPLIGATFDVAGRAEKDGRALDFTARVVVDDGTELVGAPFDVEVRDDDAVFALRILTQDPTEPDTLFDGVDFFALAPGDGPVAIAPGSEAHNALRRAFRVHDHYRVKEN
jgi:hypothetical protein